MTSLVKAIFEYKSQWYGYMAATKDDDDAPLTYKPALAVLENWSTPAQSFSDASMALELAIEFHGLGNSDVIPAMMKAALGWMEADAKRRAAE
jgi:hypothetical protein